MEQYLLWEKLREWKIDASMGAFEQGLNGEEEEANKKIGFIIVVMENLMKDWRKEWEKQLKENKRTFNWIE